MSLMFFGQSKGLSFRILLSSKPWIPSNIDNLEKAESLEIILN